MAAVKTQTESEGQIRVTFLASRKLLGEYRQAVAPDQRNVSQSLRLHMAHVVADAKANGELEDVVAA